LRSTTARCFSDLHLPIQSMNALALLTRTPHPDLVDFFSSFDQFGYDVAMVVDRADYVPKGSHPRTIRIDRSECRRNGFSYFTALGNGCCAWDKALYYFCCLDTAHDNVWFVEDDVFIPARGTFREIDSKYVSADVVSPEYNINARGELDGWYWWKSVPRKLLPPPWAHSMVCAIRLSRPLLNSLAAFVANNRGFLRRSDTINSIGRRLLGSRFRLRNHLYVEYIFHTLALHNQMNIQMARELRGITWRREWKQSEMDMNTIYHPVKDMKLHAVYRQHLMDEANKS